MIKSICLVRLSALGDVLMMVPLVRRIQDNIPDARITWVISNPAYQLVQHLEHIEFVVIDKPRNLKDYWQFRQKFKKRQFDVLLALQASLRANLLYPLIHSKRKIGYDKVRARDGHLYFINESIKPNKTHLVDIFLSFSEALSISDNNIRWDMPLLKVYEPWLKSITVKTNATHPCVIINPAASKPERSWALDNYVKLIKYLHEKYNANIYLTGGPGSQDKFFSDKFKEASLPLIDLVGKTKPQQLLHLIEKADLVICPDTGPSHMASAVGTDVIALHAVTNPDISGPYKSLDIVINKYPQAINQFGNKENQTMRWGTKVHSNHAMSLITLHEVTSEIDNVLTKKNYHPLY